MNRRNFLRASLGGIVVLTAGILAPTVLHATKPQFNGMDFSENVGILALDNERGDVYEFTTHDDGETWYGRIVCDGNEVGVRSRKE